ncbi:MAG TPA: hypothetical protein VF069_02235 [Streptosporangiaceae bacterium]
MHKPLEQPEREEFSARYWRTRSVIDLVKLVIWAILQIMQEINHHK